MNLSQTEIPIAEQYTMLDEKSWDYYWLGLFQPDGSLRDNFLMFIGESQDLNSKLYQALTGLGEIKPEYLAHGGYQILIADSNGKIHSLASVKPFRPRDMFSLVDSHEHKRLVGEKDHYDEIYAILQLKAKAEALRREDECMQAVMDAEYECNVRIVPPALDMFMDITAAPEWLKEHAADMFSTRDLHAIAVIIGFLARIGSDKHHAHAITWAKSLNLCQLKLLDGDLIRDLTGVMDEALSTGQISDDDSDQQRDIVAMILTRRDECESIVWILEIAVDDFSVNLEMIDSSLLNQGWLFETAPSEGWQLNMLRMVREHCPACWWVARAKLD